MLFSLTLGFLAVPMLAYRLLTQPTHKQVDDKQYQLHSYCYLSEFHPFHSYLDEDNTRYPSQNNIEIMCFLYCPFTLVVRCGRVFEI